MHKNVTFPIGNVALIDKIDFETGFFKTVFEPVMGKARTFIPSVKLLMTINLGHQYQSTGSWISHRMNFKRSLVSKTTFRREHCIELLNDVERGPR